MKRNPALWTAPDEDEAVRKNELRLSAEPYAFPGVFRGGGYAWPGDFEGRALLAFLCHCRIGGRKIPALTQMMETLPEHANKFLFIGDAPDGKTVNEQQLSGHNWYLRAMVDHAQTFGDPLSKRQPRAPSSIFFCPRSPFTTAIRSNAEGPGAASTDTSTAKRAAGCSPRTSDARLCARTASPGIMR